VSASLALGGPVLMSRFVPAAAPADRAAVARALGARVGRWRGLQTVALAAVAGVLVAVDPESFPLLPTLLVVVAVALSGLATLAAQISLGLGRPAVYSFRFPLENAILVIAAVALYAVAGATGAVAGIAVATAAAVTFGGAAIFGTLRRAERGMPIPAGALRFGVLSTVSGLLMQVMHRGGVVAVAVLYGSSVEAGFASLAIGIALTITYVVNQAFSVQLPSLVEQLGTGAAGAEEAALRRFTDRVQLVVVPSALVGALFLDDALTLAAGDRFAGAEPALGPALALLPLAALNALGGQTASLRLRPEIRLRATATGTAVFLVTSIVTVPLWGAVAAAAALLAGAATSITQLGLAFPDALTRRKLTLGLGSAALVLALGAAT
jgi:O-antigen/teichoic acid export membrane protein